MDEKKKLDKVVGINCKAIFGGAVRPWIFVLENAQLAAYLGYVSQRLDVDYDVEIETVVAYFTSD